MEELETRLGYHFSDPDLLTQALTHSSYANEHRDRGHNERLEFLGDAVLELSSSTFLYGHYPKDPEGSLSRRRASLVCEASLAACARTICLGEELFLGKGEEKGGGREKGEEHHKGAQQRQHGKPSIMLHDPVPPLRLILRPSR